jgi:hypothetical protein
MPDAVTQHPPGSDKPGRNSNFPMSSRLAITVQLVSLTDSLCHTYTPVEAQSPSSIVWCTHRIPQGHPQTQVPMKR